MPQAKQKPDGSYTYADYLSWGEDERIEIIDGKPVMQAAPTFQHQLVCGEIYRQLANYLQGEKCKALISPFAVQLFADIGTRDEEIKTVLEPDISVICDLSKLNKQGYKGAPDMVVEVLSPSTAKYDCLLKLNQCQKAGVKEYWIVDPEDQNVWVYLWEDGVYKSPETYTAPSAIKISVLNDCTIDLSKVFAE